MPTPTDSLLRYRPWKGTFRPPLFAAGAMARSALTILLRRKLFWAVYALAAMVFLAYFYGQYFVLWIQQFAGNARLVLFGVPIPLSEFGKLAERLNMGGTAHTFANFVWYQGHVAMIVLALAGAVLVGNDFRHGSLPFYLSKPIGRRHYVLGKVLGIGAFVNLVITLPAVGLWVQAGLLKGWQTYFWENARLLLGLLGYGAVLTVTLSLLLVASAVLVRRTVPLVMIWCGLFVLCPVLGEFLTDVQNLDPTWRLIDLWNDLYLVGLWCLGTEPDVSRVGEQPPVWQAAAAVGAVCAASWLFLRKRIRAVEIVG
jgi:ABC-type transport system involved in multi-copper enzyme maturation permease subunit